MAHWLPPEVERVRVGITRTLLVVWLIVGWIAWGRVGDRFYQASGALDLPSVAAGVVALLGAMWVTAKLVEFACRLIGGWRYTQMDQSRYDQAVIADVKRKDTINRDLHR